jgi:cytochrome c-type biogenesis protein CcmH/NrfF
MKLKYIFHSITVIVVCVAFMGANPSGNPDQRFNALGHRLMCKCGCNQVLLECNHVGCSYSTKMRDELSAALQTPDNDDLVLQRFVQEYGATVLAAPTTTGFNVIAWIVPFVVLASGLTLVTVLVRKWKYRVAPIGAQNLSEEELRDFRRKAREETKL